MITFKSLVVQNFLSYGAVPTTIQLDRPGTTLLLGEDLDHTAAGAGANGVGKTALLNALVYAVYDRPISNISKDNLVNNINKKNMQVSVVFEKGGSEYTIVRNRKMKAGAAGNFTTLFKDGKDITPASADSTNEEIVRIVGIPYEIFVRVVAFSAIHTPFLDLPTRSGTQANQTDIIEELFDLKTLSEKAILLKQVIKDTELSIKTQTEKATQIDKEHERLAKQLENAQRRVDQWAEANNAEITKIERRIANLKQVDVDQQKAILKELNDLEDDLEKHATIKDECQATISTAKKQLKDKKHELEHLNDGNCPYCNQSYTVDANRKQSIADEIADLEQQIADATQLLESNAAIIRDLATKHTGTLQKLMVKDSEELLQLDITIQRFEEKLDELKTTVNPYIEALDELKAIKLDKKDMTVINNLKADLDHQTFLLKLLTKQDSFVRKALLNKNIPFLNQRLQTYLADLGLPHTVEFTHKMTANISQFGHEMDFGNLSNGQRARVNLALSFAFRDVLQSMHDHVNICLLDEVLDVGLDTVGVQAAARMLKRKARDEKLALYVISHRDEIDSAFDRKMIVQMSGGFSTVRHEEG
jgi:DNA repair exonuclease SbcCD ATPase subunit